MSYHAFMVNYNLGQGIIDPATLIAQLLAEGKFGSGGGGTPAAQPLTVTYSGGAWSSTPAQVATARAAGSTITWVGTTVLPKTSDGLAEGDAVSGTFTQPAPTRPLAKISIPTWVPPRAIEGDQGTDFVRISKYLSLTSTVAGTDYPSDAMGSSTQDIPTGGATTVAVSVKPSDPTRFAVLENTSAWNLTFDVTSTWLTDVPPGSIPTAQDVAGTASDTVTLTSIPNVIWTVDGVDHDSASFTGTKVVPYTKGTNTTVTARGAAGYKFPAGATTSWPLTFTSTTANVGVVMSTDFGNYSNGKTFGNNDPLTFNNYAGGTATSATCKYGNISGGALNLQAGGSYLGVTTGLTTSPPPASITAEFTAVGNGGDYYCCPVYEGSSGNGYGIRLNNSVLSPAKRAAWSYSGQTPTTGANATIAGGDVIKIVADNASHTVTVFVNGTQVFTYVPASFPATWGGGFSWDQNSGSSTIDNIKISAT